MHKKVTNLPNLILQHSYRSPRKSESEIAT